MWEGSVWILMDPYGPVWVRMVPEDSLGASWGLGPWGNPKAGTGFFCGWAPSRGGPAAGLLRVAAGNRALLPLWVAFMFTM